MANFKCTEVCCSRVNTTRYRLKAGRESAGSPGLNGEWQMVNIPASTPWSLSLLMHTVHDAEGMQSTEIWSLSRLTYGGTISNQYTSLRYCLFHWRGARVVSDRAGEYSFWSASTKAGQVKEWPDLYHNSPRSDDYESSPDSHSCSTRSFQLNHFSLTCSFFLFFFCPLTKMQNQQQTEK